MTPTTPRRRPLSPKLVGPLGVTLSAAVSSAIISGEFDRAQIALFVVAAINAVVAYFVPFEATS